MSNNVKFGTGEVVKDAPTNSVKYCYYGPYDPPPAHSFTLQPTTRWFDANGNDITIQMEDLFSDKINGSIIEIEGKKYKLVRVD